MKAPRRNKQRAQKAKIGFPPSGVLVLSGGGKSFVGLPRSEVTRQRAGKRRREGEDREKAREDSHSLKQKIAQDLIVLSSSKHSSVAEVVMGWCIVETLK